MDDKVIETKVVLLGPSDVGKSSLVNFLKGTNFDNNIAQNIDNSHNYDETWGIKVNIVEWDYEGRCIRLALWESGGAFLKKFPFYLEYLLKDSNIVIYMHSLAVEDLLIERIEASIKMTRSHLKQKNLPKEILLMTKVDQGFLLHQT